MRIQTFLGDWIDAAGFDATDEWLEIATWDQTISTVPYETIARVEIYIGKDAETTAIPVGFSRPSAS